MESKGRREFYHGKYLAVITTVLVATQVVRITQNTISLARQNRLIKAQLDEVREVTDDDIKRKIEVDKALMRVLLVIEKKLEEE